MLSDNIAERSCHYGKGTIGCRSCAWYRGHRIRCAEWFSIIGLPVAIVGLILSVVGGKKLRRNEQPTGIATAGLVLGIIAVVFTAIAFFTCGLCVICAAGLEAGIESLM